MSEYRCKHFSIEELVPEETYEKYGSKCWWFLDHSALVTLDQLRAHFGATIVNDWKFGGKNHYRGLRPSDCKIGAKYSQHKFGRAFDCTFSHADSEEVRNEILENISMFPFLTAMELNTPHLHFDTRNCHRVMTFNP